MKTNHQRGFKAKNIPYKDNAYFSRRGVFSDVGLSASAIHWGYNGNQGMAHRVNGAKKFINSRFRHHENAAARRLAFEECDRD